MKARVLMTTPPITVGPETSVPDIARLLLSKRISAVPVVDDAGRLIGIVSEGDLMRRPEAGTEPRHGWWLGLLASDEPAEAYLKTHGRTAADVMTSKVVSVNPEASAAEIAEILEKRHIKRVPVIADGKPIGVVSRADLVRAVAAHGRKIPIVAVGDDALRAKILAVVRDQRLANESWFNPMVVDGVVHLWGFVESSMQRDAVRLAAASVPGVKSVADHLGIVTGAQRTALWAE